MYVYIHLLEVQGYQTSHQTQKMQSITAALQLKIYVVRTHMQLLYVYFIVFYLTQKKLSCSIQLTIICALQFKCVALYTVSSYSCDYIMQWEIQYIIRLHSAKIHYSMQLHAAYMQLCIIQINLITS